MKNLFANPFNLSEAFSFKTIVKVEELVNYDMIYVYHHLQIGSELKLLLSETRLNGDLSYVVFYKNFKLGFITLGGMFKELYSNSGEIIAYISSLSKDKYLPINSLDIQLQSLALKKVS